MTGPAESFKRPITEESKPEETLNAEVLESIQRATVQEAGKILEHADCSKDLALALINAGEASAVAFHLDKFHGLDLEVATKLIEVGSAHHMTYADQIASYPEKFRVQDGSDKPLALKLLEGGLEGIYAFLRDPKKFQHLDRDVAIKLIELRQGSYVLKMPKIFEGLILDKEIAEIFVEKDPFSFLDGYKLEEFDGLDRDLAMKILHKNLTYGLKEKVLKHKDKFSGLRFNKNLAYELINCDIDTLLKYFDQFEGIDKETILAILDALFSKTGDNKNWHRIGQLVSCRNVIPYLDEDIVLRLVEHDWNWILHSATKWLDWPYELWGIRLFVAVAKQGINPFHRPYDYTLSPFEYYEFDKNIGDEIVASHGVVDLELAKKFIVKGHVAWVRKHIKLFPDDTHKRIALEMIHEKCVYGAFSEYFKEFKGFDLNEEFAIEIMAYCGSEIYVSKFDFRELDLDFLRAQAAQLHIRLPELCCIKISPEKNSSHIFIDDEAGYKKRFEALNNSEHGEWSRNALTVAEPFKAGAQIFGYRRMFEYIDCPNLSRHDALLNFQKIVELFQASTLTPDQFYHQILAQVSDDGGHYDQGTAHHVLNLIAVNISLDLDDVHAMAYRYQQIEHLADLAGSYPDKKCIFASWRALKKYAELVDILSRQEMLESLEEMQGEENAKLRSYVERLAFHPNINMEKVLQFWRDPHAFLEIPDEHSQVTHERKKPSNYVEIPCLDLTAEGLRDALVEGALDSLQVFHPMVIEYEVAPEPRTLLRESFGSRREGISGKARSPKKLFSRVNTLFKARGLSIQEYLAGKKDISSETEEQLVRLIYDKEIGMKTNGSKKYRAQIHLKSDPEGVVAGNDTACCMPFGSGKNNVYTFNPDMTLFTIQEETAVGRWRTICQSVMDKDMDVKMAIPKIVSRLNEDENAEIPLSDILPEDVLSNSRRYVSADNAEVAQNAKTDPEKVAVITKIYEDFFAEYLERFAEQDHVEAHLVPIGEGYSETLQDLPHIPNTFAPLAPAAYSDKTGETVYQLTPQKHRWKTKQISMKEKPKNSSAIHSDHLPKNISSLTFEDSLAVSYIEGKAYASNTSLMEYLHNMENGLIAKDINNSRTGRPNLSLQYRDEHGKMRGYLLAYEGKFQKNSSYEDREEVQVAPSSGEPIIYIADLAADKEKSIAGGKLVMGFIQLYKEHYLDTGKDLPLYFQARESTSYALVLRQLDRIGKELRIHFQMEDIGEYKINGEIMKEVIIRPVRYGKEEIAA